MKNVFSGLRFEFTPLLIGAVILITAYPFLKKDTTLLYIHNSQSSPLYQKSAARRRY